MEQLGCLDQAEIQSFQQGSWLGMQNLWERYQPLCLSLVKKYGGREKENLLAEIKIIFIQLLLEYQIDSPVPLAGYLKNKLERRVYNYLRKINQVRQREILLDLSCYRKSFSKEEISSPALAFIGWNNLTDQQKRVLELIYDYGYSERETAKELRVSPSRVNKVKKLALERLRRGEQS